LPSRRIDKGNKWRVLFGNCQGIWGLVSLTSENPPLSQNTKEEGYYGFLSPDERQHSEF